MKQPYDVCVIDIGSPKLGNLGWCLKETISGREHTGFHLDTLFPHIKTSLENRALLLGLEAPIFVPLRGDLMLATKARKGEGRRPWSAGAGAQVLAMNMPIMAYLFAGIYKDTPKAVWHLNEEKFAGEKGHIMVFEALVSGADKGQSHINDAEIMARYCSTHARQKKLPPTILEHEEETAYFNLAAAAMLRCGIQDAPACLAAHSPIYKP